MNRFREPALALLSSVGTRDWRPPESHIAVDSPCAQAGLLLSRWKQLDTILS